MEDNKKPLFEIIDADKTMDGYLDRMMRPAKALRARAERWIGERCLEYGIKKAPEYFNAKVVTVSTMATRRLVRDEMQKQGLLKCSVETCLKRSPLQYFGKDLVCRNHHEILSRGQKLEGVGSK